jgi:hypothetical protein
MRGTRVGFLSSAGRFATGLLSFRYTDWINQFVLLHDDRKHSGNAG